MLIQRVFEHARTRPHHPAVVWNGHAIGYLRLAQGIASLRSAWQPLAPPPGNVVVLVVHSLLESWAAVLALQSLGLVTVCTRSLLDAESLGLGDSPAAVLCSRKAARNRPRLPAWPQARELPLPADLFHHPITPAVPMLDGLSHRGGHILYTSGTTGHFKKLLRKTLDEAQRLERRIAAEGLTEHTVWNVVDFGLWTSIGYGRPLTVWHVGGTAVFDQRSDWPLHLGDHGTTHTTLMPGALDQALKTLPRESTNGPPWSFELAIGGGPLSPTLAREVLARLTSRLRVIYACTELGQVLHSVVTDPAELHWLTPVGTRPVEIVSEDGQPCPDGVEGLLRVRPGPLDLAGYLDDAASTERVFRAGWFYPGDLAVRRGDGRIRILGRTSDVINLGGSKVASGPIEEIVRETLGASAVCAFSGPDASGEDRVVLVIEISHPASPQQLQEASTAAGLRSARFVQLREFPRTRTGTLKIDRLSLRRQVMSPHPTP